MSNRIEFPPWYGEFGWEVMTWAPLCRRQAQGYDEVVVTSFADMAPLYADFATEFRSHGETARRLDYPKHYRLEGVHFRYGRPSLAQHGYDVLIHGRNIRRKTSINYRRWIELRYLLHWQRWIIGWIGSAEDYFEPVCGWDLRSLELQSLMDTIAASGVVIGVSSGLMHLAAACGTDLVVWGDRRTYFGETLEQRYKHTWNPHGVNVGWIDADDWQPDPQRIIEEIERILEQGTTNEHK